MHTRAEFLIRHLRLLPHPEGGYFRELFRSDQEVLPHDGRGGRSALTTIYYLLAAGQQSRLHRVGSDEVWHFYEGEPLELLWVDRAEERCNRTLLAPVGVESAPVHVVPAGCWQAARPLGDYALVGCSVGPGFDFADFEMISRDSAEAARLAARFPEFRGLL